MTAPDSNQSKMKPRGFGPVKPPPLPPYDRVTAESVLWSVIKEEIESGRNPRSFGEFNKRLLLRNEFTAEEHRWRPDFITHLFGKLVINDGDRAAYRLFDDLHPKATTPHLTPTQQYVAAEEERVAKDQLRQVMAVLGVSYKRAYVIMREGTALPDQARLLAERIGGTTAADWMRAKSYPGRHAPPISKTILATTLDGCSMLDFTEAVPAGDALRIVSDALRWVEEQYRMRGPLAKSFVALEDLIAGMPKAIPRGQVEQLWCRFRIWRAEKIVAALEMDALDAELHDPT